jgi:hypothetical protein
MEHRLGRTVRVFLVVLATAGLYRLAVVPWVEPRYRETVDVEELPQNRRQLFALGADRRLETVRELFPPGAWEHEEPHCNGKSWHADFSSSSITPCRTVE